MAIQFPNFLSVPVRAPDYSGFGDMVQNYYAGKSMPKDDLIRAIQAEFARPNAEESLKLTKLNASGKRLSNQKEQLDINRLMQEASEQKAFEQQLRQALMGGASGAMGSSQGATQPTEYADPYNSPASMNPALGKALAQTQPQPQPQQDSQSGISYTTDLVADGIDPTKIQPQYRKIDQQATGLPDSAYKPGARSAGSASISSNQPAVAPALSQPEEPHEIVVAAGSPHLASIDAMWDNNPLSRAFLEKKGYKKTQDIKFNSKTGQTTIITKYTSGTVTTKSIGGIGGAAGSAGEAGKSGETGEAPLTSRMVSQHQKIVAAVDVAVPVVQELADMGSYPRQSIFKGSQYADYEGKVSQAIDSVLGAFGLPMTNEGMKTIRDQVEIKTFETPGHYKKRMEKLIDDLRSRQKYSAGEVKKTLKNPVVSKGSDQDPYGLSSYDDSGSGDEGDSQS